MRQGWARFTNRLGGFLSFFFVMKVSSQTRPVTSVQEQTVPARSPADRPHPTALPAESQVEFRVIYDAWFHHVSRWVRALGGPDADRDDIVQEVFLVVRRRLRSFDGGNLAGWLYRITRRQVRDFRRRVWVKHIFSRGHMADLHELPNRQNGPGEALELKEDQRILHGILSGMNDDRRATFVLFEIEGHSGQEIARIQNIPVNTVWTRLHHARREFFALVAKYQKTQERKGRSA